jgi:hypothetical protein
MLRWDALGEMCVGIEAGDLVCRGGEVDAFVASCTVPLVVHDYGRAAVLATGTLLMAGRCPVLLTAAHVFEGGIRFCNLLVPLADCHGFESLAGARLHASHDVDIALVDLSGAPALASLLRGRRLPALHHAGARRRRGRRGTDPVARRERALLCGFPAALSRFERGWLAARRLTLMTRRRVDPAAMHCGADRLFDYGRLGSRDDGTCIHTPALEGMSGAAIWAVEPVEAPASSSMAVRLCLDAVQSAYVHGRYLRGHDIGAAMELFRQVGAAG